MFARRVAESWESFGRSDPYFGVLNVPRFREAGREGPARAAFFATGEEHVTGLFAAIHESLCPDFAPARALDFGCGVGRVILPLARRVPLVTGVDISRGMLDEAQRNCARAGLGNVTLLEPHELDSTRTTFDLIHSYIVFQHMPQRMGMQTVRKLLTHLEENGIGALHFVYGSRLPRWRTYIHWMRKRVPGVHPALNVLQRRPLRSPLMQMNAYDIGAILRVLQECGCHRVAIRFSDHGGWLGVMLLFQRRTQLDVRVT